MRDAQRDTIEFLGNPQSYTPRPPLVERRETHGAIVFLAGNCAYKLKRAVRYPYMDYSTASIRGAMCERELAINRHIAPELYLEVRPLVRDVSGAVRFGRPAESGRAIDWVLVMRRFDESGLLAEVRRRNELTPAVMRRLGETIAAFHGSAEPLCTFGGANGIRAVIDENAALLPASGLDGKKISRLNALSYDAVDKLGPLLDRRREEGRVRRCHGDLHLNNICLIEGNPVLFDAIEFSAAFSCIDVLYDLAFLLMDLMRNGLDACANVLLNRYLELTGDYLGLAALPLFLSCRAAITAHVTVSRAREAPTHSSPTAAQANANHLLDFALACFARDPPRLIAIGGISGSGKSTLAYSIAHMLHPAPGGVVLRSDIIRKRILGVAEDVRLSESGYSPDMHARVYAELAKLAASILESGWPVVVDAVFGTQIERAQIARAAAGRGSRFLGWWLAASPDVVRRRIAERRDDASDATVRVVNAQIAKIEAPAEWTAIDANGPPEQTLALARSALEKPT